MIQKSYNKEKNIGNLYLIPTPIGNMEDITLRALEILKSVDIIYAEDTRTTNILLKNFGINKPLKSCHIYNEKVVKLKMIDEMKLGKNIALVSDRGTPLLSDPGFEVVDYAIQNAINVISLPGPSALLPALNMSGIEANKFLFYGFLNSKDSSSKQELVSLKDLPFTIVFYESPHRFLKTLNNILNILGNRNISVCREISKIYEEVFRGYVTDALDYYKDIKGEIVIVVEKPELKSDYVSALKEVCELNIKGVSVKDATKEVAKKYFISKNILYNMLKEKNK